MGVYSCGSFRGQVVIHWLSLIALYQEVQKLNPKVKIIVAKENDDNYLRRRDEIDRAFMQLRCYSLIIMFLIGVINKTIGIKNVEVYYFFKKFYSKNHQFILYSNLHNT